MRSLTPHLLVFGALVLLLALGSPVVHSDGAGQGQSSDPGLAAEGSASNLKLIKSWIKTRDESISLTTAPVDAFSPTSVACPGSAPSCTLRIEVSSQFGGVDAGTGAYASVTVNGSGAGVEPNPTVSLSNNPTGVYYPATMSWMVEGIAAGTNPSVAVKFGVGAGNATAAYRTLTIGVYKP